MNLKELREMIELMEEHGLIELELERDGQRIRLKKGAGVVEGSPAVTLAPALAVTEAPPKPPTGVEIKSPMVGTFYHAPSPEATPFVEVGQLIEVGQVLCIIEAMKLMNEIKAEVRGRLIEILAENGEPVEFGQPLFRVEPT